MSTEDLYQNIDLLIRCIDEPDTLVNEACEAGIVTQPVATMLSSNAARMDNKLKSRTILEHVIGVLYMKPELRRPFLAVLQNQPDMKSLLYFIHAASTSEWECSTIIHVTISVVML